MNKIVENIWAKLAINMVTRKLRDNDPKNYIHASKEEFEQYRSDNKFLSITENSYQDKNWDRDINYYGYLKEPDMKSSDILLIHGTRHSLMHGLIGKDDYNIHTFYLTLDEDLRISRILGRSDWSQDLLDNFLLSRKEFDDDMGTIEHDEDFISEHNIHFFDMTDDVDTLTKKFIQTLNNI